MLSWRDCSWHGCFELHALSVPGEGDFYSHFISFPGVKIYKTSHLTKFCSELLSGTLSSREDLIHCTSPFRKLTSLRLRGESMFVRVWRGGLAISLLFALLAFSAFSIIIGPIHQMGLVPSKVYRAPDILYDFNMEIPVWSIVVVSGGI